MERWSNRVAVVTGASAGIGVAVVKDLLKANLIVVGLARRLERMEAYKKELPAEQKKRFHPYVCDVSSKESVDKAFMWIIEKLGGIDVLVNNAGIMLLGQTLTLDPAQLQKVVQTNIMGIVHCTQHAFKSMRDRDVDGHVVNVNSVLGHYVYTPPDKKAPIHNLYGPTKYAVTALTEIYRQEFSGLGTKIKVTSISPGFTKTDIVPDLYREAQPLMLQAEDISSCIIFTLSTPPHMQVHDIIAKPLGGEI